MMLGKLHGFLKSKTFLYIFLLFLSVLFSILFYIYAPLLAFNDVRVFGSAFVRWGVIVAAWLIAFSLFALKPFIDFLQSLKNEEKIREKELKQEILNVFHKAQRNYFLAMKDAKNTWKRTISFKNIPFIIVIGNEGAGKSSFINYANIEYPISDNLEVYKKFHKSTNNFSLYISKDGALLDTEGNYFTQETLFQPDTTDEIATDDIEKNKEFLVKRGVWNKFLAFLNHHVFHSKLNGVICVIDTQAFLNEPREYSNNLIQSLIRRINECEEHLGLSVPIYIVFSKLDLVEGMQTYFHIFNENIANKVLGITLDSCANKQILQSQFQKLSQSLLYTLMKKNKSLYSLHDKNKAFLFLKQLDILFALIVDFVAHMKQQNALKNKSYIRGIYFTSAYQENTPRNYVLDAICDKYEIKKPATKPTPKQIKKSYFIQSLLQHIVLKDFHLNSITFKNPMNIIRITLLFLSVSLFAYLINSFYIKKTYNEIAQSSIFLKNINNILSNMYIYDGLSLNEKVELMLKIKTILRNYPSLFHHPSFSQYLFADTAYKGFLPAKEFYDFVNKDVITRTLINEMEHILTNSSDATTLIETLYIYTTLFNEEYFERELLIRWIHKYWKYFDKYNLVRDDFMTNIQDITLVQIINIHPRNHNSISTAQQKIARIPQSQRIYTLMSFRENFDGQSVYNLKDKIGAEFNDIFEYADQFDSINKTYTREGLMQFLSNFYAHAKQALDIDALYLEIPTQDVDVRSLYDDIVGLHLDVYKQKWDNILQILTPRYYTHQADMLKQLKILSNPTNPLNNLIKLVNENTYLDNAILLSYAYSLGFPSKDIKARFANISDYFRDYHKFIHTDSLLDTTMDSIGGQAKKDNNETVSNNKPTILAQNMQNMHAKIIDFTNNPSKNIKEKLIYILDGSDEEGDVFKKLKQDSEQLPQSLRQYYKKIALLSSRLLDSHAPVLLNNAWKNEIYMQFTNEISSFYPFNIYSKQSLPLDTFKGFFGNTGALQTFYQQYLSKILQRRGNAYIVNPKYASRFQFKTQFLSFLNEIMRLDAMFDVNNNITLNFFIQCRDLSSEFNSIDIEYNDKSLRYDHTLNSKIHIIVEQFNNSTELRLSANDYNNNPQYKKIYSGSWAWFAFLRDIQPGKNTQNSIYFNEKRNLYFDFNITPNKLDLLKITDILAQFNMPHSIM